MALSMPSREESEARLSEAQKKIAERMPDATLAAWWRERVDIAPERIVVRTDDRDLTYREFDALINRVVRWGRALDLHRGDTVAIQLPAGPAFLALILGMAELGVRLSLLGTGLRGRSLRHALHEIPPRQVITTSMRRDEIDRLDVVAATSVHALAGTTDDAAAGLDALDALLASAPPSPHASAADEQDRSSDAADPDDTLFYIFTSGTTGLPKATRCSHRRYLAGVTSEAVLLDMDETDRMYVVLPMFHISALSAIGAALSVTASVVIRPRFSASRFWRDVHAFSATTFQYLGEILRYLVAQPPSDTDRPNTMRAMIGAGAETNVWRAFVTRFGPVRIVESYGSSEGVIGVFNLDGVVGSVGRPTNDLSERLAIVRLAPTPDGLARNADGQLVRCDPGEAGELIARLSSRDEFEGYSSAEATQSKLLVDAFQPGDVWYRSGDRFREDGDGYLYFVSRLGDTYRWKGENVSTQQVAEAISDCHFVAHAVVYGVEVPGHEGRAGMALVTLGDGSTFDGAALHAHLERELIGPAIPLFVRLGDGTGRLTETYKLAMADLARDGYSPELVADPLYVLDPSARSYVPLTPATLTRLGLPASMTAHDSGVNHG